MTITPKVGRYYAVRGNGWIPLLCVKVWSDGWACPGGAVATESTYAEYGADDVPMLRVGARNLDRGGYHTEARRVRRVIRELLRS